jgi:anti-sigma factor RsiW
MSSILEQVDRDESYLLLYLADELPAGEQALLEQRLRTDDALSAKLEVMRSLRDEMERAVGQVDQATPLAAKQDAVVRGTRRMLDQWHADRLAKAARTPVQKGLRYPWWAYPVATAAAIILAFVVWWKNIDSKASFLPPQDYATRFDPSGFTPEMEQFRQLEWSIGELATVQTFEQDFEALAVLGEPSLGEFMQ